jgi:hypothetical protein
VVGLVESICSIYWNNEFFHYFLFGFLGPLLGLISGWFLIKRFKVKFWPKALAVITFLNLGSCEVSHLMNVGCQELMFGEVDSDPGDIGVIAITIPIFFISLSLSLLLLYFLKRDRRKLR